MATKDSEHIEGPFSSAALGDFAARSLPRTSPLESPHNPSAVADDKGADSQEAFHLITTDFLAERVNQIQSEIADVRAIIKNQKLLNEEYVCLVKEMINQQAVSPHVGSNSPKVGNTTTIEGNSGKSQATLRTYKRKKTATPTATSNDPDYLPIPTPPSSPDGCTFRFKRNNTSTRSRSTPTAKGRRPTGKRMLFSGSAPGVTRTKGEKTYITSSSIPALQYAEQQNFLQIRHVDRSQWATEIGKIILRGMALTFFPTKDIKIVGIDLCVAAYIFNTKLDQDELLVPNAHCAIARGALRTLEPRKPVVDDVLILLADMLTRNSTRIHWFLPTTFSQIATGRGPIPHATVKAIRDDFMDKADRVCKIYCPIWCDGHWFLLVVDVIRRELVYLDSLPSQDARAKRVRQLKKVAIFLEELMDNDDWYDDPKKPRVLCSDFELKEPKVVMQDPGSNDCGMYVAQWMVLYHLWNSYEIPKVTDYSRMRLAIDMVRKYHNDKRIEIIQAALDYWRNFTKGSPATK